MLNYRSARPEEVDQIIKLTDLVFRESRDVSPSMGRQFPTLLDEDNASNLYVAEDNGRVISHIGMKKNTVIIYGHKISMASMGAVCTHPDYRGMGIGTRLLHETFKGLDRQGISLITISGGRNLYRRNGAVDGGRTTKFNITQELEIPEYVGISYRIMNDEEDVSSLAPIYHRESIRYERTKEEFDILFKAKPMVLTPDETPFFSVIGYNTKCSFDGGIAYILGFASGNGIFNIVEYAGERGVVLGAINHILQEMDLNSVFLDVPSQDKMLIGMLASLNVKGDTPDGSPMTIRIINRESLWREVYPIIREQWEGGDIPQTIEELPDDVIIDDISSLTSFIFNGYNRPQHGGQWDDIFPLPLPWYRGLNYI